MKKFGIIFLLLTTGAVTFWSMSRSLKEPPEWMLEQIQEDMSFFSKKDLYPKHIEKYFSSASKDEKLVHFQIKNNKIYLNWNWGNEEGIDRLKKVCGQLKRASKRTKLPDVDFLLTVHDGVSMPTDYEEGKVPLFGFSKEVGTAAVLFPDPLTYSFANKGLLALQKAQRKSQFKWEEKEEKAFWRGGTTGGDFTLENWHLMPRTRLSLISQYHPEDVDAGYSVFNPMPGEVKSEMLNVLPLANWVDHKGHLKYKYLVIADGNTCTYPRLCMALASGSVVFKHETKNMQWFYRALKPNEHYVSLVVDFSDLPEKVQWARCHDDQVREIANKGRQFATQNLQSKSLDEYIIHLLRAYAALQDSAVDVHPDALQYKGSITTLWGRYE